MSSPRRVSRQFLAWWVRDSDRWDDPRIAGGKFYANESTKKHPHVWTAVDNCGTKGPCAPIGCEFYTEEFRTRKDAIAWLLDPESRTGDDFKKEVLHYA